MGRPAIRLGDPHVCPAKSPAEHGGGAITGPGEATVLIGGVPAARVGDSAACTGAPAPNAITAGSTTVLVGGLGAARVGDPMAHGGTVVTGEATVLVGD